jgi:hypothetical protein
MFLLPPIRQTHLVYLRSRWDTAFELACRLSIKSRNPAKRYPGPLFLYKSVEEEETMVTPSLPQIRMQNLKNIPTLAIFFNYFSGEFDCILCSGSPISLQDNAPCLKFRLANRIIFAGANLVVQCLNLIAQ